MKKDNKLIIIIASCELIVQSIIIVLLFIGVIK